LGDLGSSRSAKPSKAAVDAGDGFDVLPDALPKLDHEPAATGLACEPIGSGLFSPVTLIVGWGSFGAAAAAGASSGVAGMV
jgi:hypothetical protein